MKSYIPEPIEHSLQEYFQSNGQNLMISGFSFASGGCINSAGVIETNLGKKFIKWNDRRKFPGMFEAEFKGLELLRNPAVIHVPEPQIVGNTEQFAYLVIEFVDKAHASNDYWDQLGQNLAALHKISSERFGLDHNNYVGSLIQVNDQKDDWIDFYINHRLEYQLKMAIDSGRMDQLIIPRFQKLYSVLESTYPKEPPSLIHGDLWGGNLMTGPRGEPVIFDPAVYYGNREIDLAMTRLFGGFDSRFYDSYNEAFPIVKGYQDRVDIYQIYPLLVHVNLFAGGYISQVKHILNRYI